MNIWLPIITNLFMLLVLVVNIFNGKKNGWRVQLLKTIITAGVAVGFYFLTPIITDKLFMLPVALQFIGMIPVPLIVLVPVVNMVLFLILFFSVNTILNSIINKIAKNSRNKKLRRIQPTVVNGNERKYLKLQYKEYQRKRTKRTKIFGMIFGCLVGIVYTFVLMTAYKYTCMTIRCINPSIPEIEVGYEATIYGQIESRTNIDLNEYNNLNKYTLEIIDAHEEYSEQNPEMVELLNNWSQYSDLYKQYLEQQGQSSIGD